MKNTQLHCVCVSLTLGCVSSFCSASNNSLFGYEASVILYNTNCLEDKRSWKQSWLFCTFVWLCVCVRVCQGPVNGFVCIRSGMERGPNKVAFCLSNGLIECVCLFVCVCVRARGCVCARVCMPRS